MSVLKKILIAFVVLFILLGVFANYQKERFREINKPLLTLASLSVTSKELVLDESMQLKLQVKNNKLILIRANKLESQVLFSSNKNKYDYIKLFHKDIDFDGQKELIFLVEDKLYVSDIYIYSNLYNKKINKYKKSDFIWNGDGLRFSSEDKMFIRSCGSQYCNDTYYLWNGIKLKKEYTDSYESM